MSFQFRNVTTAWRYCQFTFVVMTFLIATVCRQMNSDAANDRGSLPGQQNVRSDHATKSVKYIHRVFQYNYRLGEKIIIMLCFG